MVDNIQPRTPSNIMIKSAFPFYQQKEPNYIIDTIIQLYQYIKSVDPSEWETIEIEAKLGIFNFKGNNVQCYQSIKDPFQIPIFDKTDQNYRFFKYDFSSGLNENQFNSIWYFVNKESENVNSEIKLLEHNNYKETHYKSGFRRQVAFKNGVALKEEIIHKKDKQHINIRNNGKDFRITACREEKQFGIPIDDTIVSYREKFRVSYKFRYLRLDFTIVSSYRDINLNSSKEISYEIELEFEELKNYLVKEFKTFEDFKMMFLRFIQNIFTISEISSVEYYNSRFAKPRFPNDSLFGDYFDYNLK